MNYERAKHLFCNDPGFRYTGILTRYQDENPEHIRRCVQTMKLCQMGMLDVDDFDDWYRVMRRLMHTYLGTSTSVGGFANVAWLWKADLFWLINRTDDPWPSTPTEKKSVEYAIAGEPRFSLRGFSYPSHEVSFALMRRSYEHFRAARGGSFWRVPLFFRDFVACHWFGRGNTGLPQVIVNALFHELIPGRHDLAAYRLTTEAFIRYWYSETTIRYWPDLDWPVEGAEDVV